jgi:hypothetical protein
LNATRINGKARVESYAADVAVWAARQVPGSAAQSAAAVRAMVAMVNGATLPDNAMIGPDGRDPHEALRKRIARSSARLKTARK